MSEQRIATVISDFGGVLTTPLVSSFAAVQDDTDDDRGGGGERDSD